MQPRVSLITLGVHDLDRARRFYEQGLGWQPSSASVDDVVFFQLAGGLVLALYPREELAKDARLPAEGSGFSGITLAHNVPERELVDATLAQAAAVGATIVKPAEDAFWGGRSGYFADPEGHLWEVAWNPGFPMAADGTIHLPD